MSKIKIERAHSLSLTTATERANRIGTELREEFGLQADWKSKTVAYVSGKGINGTMTITDSKVVIELRLGFALKLCGTTSRSSAKSSEDLNSSSNCHPRRDCD